MREQIVVGIAMMAAAASASAITIVSVRPAIVARPAPVVARPAPARPATQIVRPTPMPVVAPIIIPHATSSCKDKDEKCKKR